MIYSSFLFSDCNAIPCYIILTCIFTCPMPKTSRIVSLDYLKAFVIVLVVFLHSILAYPSWAFFNVNSFLNSSAPIVDPARCEFIDFIPSLLNGFFMALLFFISGLFVYQSLLTKGPVAFVRTRFKRLGIPFVFALSFVMPIAFYPSFLMSGSTKDFISFWFSWSWTSGPAWFLSLLLLFNCYAVIVYRLKLFPSFSSANFIVSNPLVFFLVLVFASGFVYFPLMYFYGPFQWSSFGPLLIGQTSRLLFYLVYFSAGLIVGRVGLSSTFLLDSRVFLRRSFVWLIASAILGFIYFDSLKIVPINLTVPWSPPSLWWINALIFCFYSAILLMSSFLLSFIFFSRRVDLLDHLSANSFGIYILHYPFVVWAQFYLLPFHLPGCLKFLIVFTFAFFFSWWTSSLIRISPRARYLLGG